MADARTALARRLAGIDSPTTMEGFGVDPGEMERQGGYDAESGAEFARMVGATGASAADPLGIPSAVTGMVSPSARDDWRAYQSSAGIVPQIAGSLMGGTAGLKVAGAGAKGAIDLAGRLSGAAVASDVVDAAAGKDDALNRTTLAKAMLAPVGSVPGRATNAALGAAGGGMLMSGEAKAQSMTPEMRARQGELRSKKRLNNREAAELKQLNDTEAATAGAEAQAQRQREDQERENAARIAEEDRQRRVAAETEAGDRAQAAYDKRMSDIPLAQTPWEDTWIGRNVNPVAKPAVMGALVGALLGRKSSGAARKNADAWQSALDDAASATVPSQKLRREADAVNIGSTFKDSSTLADYAPAFGLGAAGGGLTAAAPWAWDSRLPKENAEYAAIEEALKALPTGHPGRAYWEQRLATTDPETPARKTARETGVGDLATQGVVEALLGGGSAITAKTLSGLRAPSTAEIARMRAMTPKQAPDVTPDATAAEALRMRGVQQADADYQGATQRLAGERQLADAASQLEQEALQGIVAKGVPKDVQQAVRRKLAEAMAGQPARSANPQPVPEVLPSPQSTSIVPASAEPARRPAPMLPPPAEDVASKLVMPQGVKANPNWAEKSPSARAALIDLMAQGGSLKKSSGSGTTGAITARQLVETMGDGAPSVGVTQNAMTRLRAVMAENGIDPNTATQSQVAALLQRLDPGVFAAPLAIGGAAALSAGQDAPEPEMTPEQRARLILARQMAGSPTY